MVQSKKQLRSLLADCKISDRFSLKRRIARLKGGGDEFTPLAEDIKASCEWVEKRKKLHTAIAYPDLPISLRREEISKAIEENQVVVLAGETGSGKTTQLPKICLDLGLGCKGLIGHTQPRRLAARSVAARIAEELQTPLGERVGYQVRFHEQVNETTQVKLMTDGILLAETKNDRFLEKYEVLIIDEAHERSLNIDLLLGVVKNLLVKRPDLKLIITSATIDTERFAHYFSGAPIINVSGRTYPVEIQYRPLNPKEDDLTQAIINSIEFLNKKRPEDTLVFLPGERHIREVKEKAEAYFQGKFEVLSLYGRLSFADQQKIFKRSSRAKIVLSTNVAETSLTVPGIKYVIDSGLVRMSRYSWRTKTQGLPIEKISQASANQRSGRCGRVAPGTAVRLYAEEDYEQRPEFTDSEILRTNLATVILQMSMLKMGHLEDFDFIEAPDSRLIKDGYRLLKEIKAVDEQDKVTADGRSIARFPLDPSYSKMVLTASKLDCLKEVLVIVSGLSIQDPRETPIEHRQKAKECHQQWQDKESDFLSYWLLWQRVAKEQKELSHNQFKKWCNKNFLAYMRLREWRDVYRQLKQIAIESKLSWNEQDAASDNLHRSILSGVPSHIACLQIDDKKKKLAQGKNKPLKQQLADYLATRNRALKIFPASGVKKPPKWLMAASFIDTKLLYAHEIAQCDPAWLMSDLKHLHRYEYSEPHFQARFGRVSAYRNTRIYNLLIEAKKRVNFSTIDAVQSRDIFIRQGLIDGEYSTLVQCINDNRDLVNFYRQEEDKLRRRELLVDDEFLYDFYHQRLPQHIVDGPAFEKWAKGGETSVIALTKEDVLVKQHEQAEQDYPENIEVRNQHLALSYQFKPGSEADGVTVNIPLALLNQFYDEDFESLVPGFIEQKIQALLRSLPKTVRKNFVPIPDFSRACLMSLEAGQGLLEQITEQLRRMTGVIVQQSDWNVEQIDDYLKMRYCILKEGECVKAGRSLERIKQSLSGQASEQFEQEVTLQQEHVNEELTQWSCGTIEPFVLVSKTQIKAFPALVDYQDYVLLELLDTQEQAQFYHIFGIARLISFQLKPEIKAIVKSMSQQSSLFLMYLTLGDKQSLIDDVITSSIMSLFLSADLPYDQTTFDKLVADKKQNFYAKGLEQVKLCHDILTSWRAIVGRLQSELISPLHRDDIEEQMNFLIYEGFIRDVSVENLRRYPKYLLAINKRLDKLSDKGHKLDAKMDEIQHYWQFYLTKMDDDQVPLHLKEQLRWSIEEYRISSFAQPMKPIQPISAHKIERLIAKF